MWTANQVYTVLIVTYRTFDSGGVDTPGTIVATEKSEGDDTQDTQVKKKRSQTIRGSKQQKKKENYSERPWKCYL